MVKLALVWRVRVVGDGVRSLAGAAQFLTRTRGEALGDLLLQDDERHMVGTIVMTVPAARRSPMSIDRLTMK